MNRPFLGFEWQRKYPRRKGVHLTWEKSPLLVLLCSVNVALITTIQILESFLTNLGTPEPEFEKTLDKIRRGR